MLALARKLGEGVVIGENITVRILGVERGRVKVGTDAPLDVRIDRGELLDKRRVYRSKERF